MRSRKPIPAFLILAITLSAQAQQPADPGDSVGFLGEVGQATPSRILLNTPGPGGQETRSIRLLPTTKFTAGDWTTLRPGQAVFVGVQPDGDAFAARVIADLSGGGPAAQAQTGSAGISTSMKTGRISASANALLQPGALYATTTISGSMTTTTGQNVAGLTLQLYSVSSGAVIGTLTTSSSGTFSVTGEFVGDYNFRLLDSNGRILSYSPVIFVIPGNNVSGVKVPVEPMCKAGSGYQPTSNSIDFIGCIGLPTLAFSTDLNIPLYSGPNPDFPALSIVLTRLDLTVTAGGGAYEFPFRFSAVDITTRDLEAWSNNCIATGQSLNSCPGKPAIPAATAPRPVAVSVQRIGPPGPALTWGGGLGPKLSFRITTGIGCGAVGLSPCTFNTSLTPSPFFYSAQSPAGAGAPIAGGGTLNAGPVACIPVGFKQVLASLGVPSIIAGYISPLDFELCEPARITAPPNGFIAQLSGISGVVTFQGQAGGVITNPSLGFTGGEYTVYMQPDSSVNNTSIRFSSFNYVPTFEDQFQLRVTVSGNQVVATTDPLTVQTQQVPFIATPFPPAGSATLQGTQRTFIDIPIAVAASGSITLTDHSPTGVGVTGGTTVTIHGKGFSPAKFASGAPIPGTGVTDVLYTGQSVTLSNPGGYTIVSDTELTVVVPRYFTAAPALADLTILGWGGSQTFRLNVVPQPVIDMRGISAWNAPAGMAQPVIGIGFRHYLFDQSAPAPKSVTGVSVDGVAAVFTQCTSASTSTLCKGAYSNTNLWVFEAPRMSAGPHHVTVTAACDETSGLTTGAYCGPSITGTGAGAWDTLNYQGTPHLTGLSKSRGVVPGGEQITLTGSGFLGYVFVKFGNTTTAICNTSPGCAGATPSDTSLTVTAPPGSAGAGVPVQVTVTGPFGISAPCPGVNSSCADSEVLIYSYFGPPTLTSLSPTGGAHGGGTVVTLTGTGLTSTTGVTLGGLPVSYTVVDDQRITITTPAGYPGLVTNLPGSVNIAVTTSCGAGFPAATSCGVSNTIVYTYNPPGNLTATAVNVAAVTGPAGGTAAMTATLRAGGAAIPGRTITFTANGAVAGSAVTDAQGVATLGAGSLAGVTSGIYSAGVAAAWGGDLVYAPSTATNQLTAKTSAILMIGPAPAVPPVDHIAQIVSGYSRVLALTDTGSVLGWGSTPWTPSSLGATLVPAGLSGITSLATAKLERDTSAALRADGSVAVWNDLGVGQCSGCNLKSVAVSPGKIIMLGVDNTSKVIAWGNAQEDTTSGILSVPAAALSGVSAVAAGKQHGVALKTNGTVVTWGCIQAQLCSNSSIAPPAGLTSVVAVAAGSDGSTLALKQDGSITRWGGFSGSNIANFTGKRFVAVDFDGNGVGYALADDGSLFNVQSGQLVGSAGPGPLGFSAGAGWFAVRVPQRLAAAGTLTGVTGKVGDSKTITATFTSGEAPVAGVSVAFALNGASLGTAVTNSSGVATMALTIPTLPGGVYGSGLTATVASDATWQGATAAANLTVVTLPQTISFPDVSSRVYGDPAFVLGATASSGLPVTYTVNGGPVTVNGATATMTGSGSVSITASQPGSGLYDPAASVTKTFNIAKATLIVTPSPATKVYGTELTTLTGTVTGFKYADAGTAVGDSLGQPATAAAGSYPITAAGVSFSSGDSANYVLQLNTLPNGLTVTKAPLTITATPATKVYGQVAAFSFTSSGLKNADTVASVTFSSPGAATAAAPSTTPYVVTAGAALGAGLANYTITYVDGTLTVNKATLTISGSGAKTYGYSDSLRNTFTSTGLVNGDTVVSVTFDSPGLAQFAPVSGSPYPLTLSAAAGTGLDKYNITYVTGTLAVSKATLEISATSRSKTYGVAISLSTTDFLIDPVNRPLGTDTVTSVQLSSAGSPATAPVGSYPILAGSAAGAGLANYTILYRDALLTVNPAPLTIRPAITTRQYGQSLSGLRPASAFAVTGLLLSDTVTGGYFTGQGADSSASANAAYPLAPCAAVGTGLANYEISYVEGAVQVTPAPVTFTVQSSTVVYDGKPHPTVPVTSPAGVAMRVTYNSSLTPPTNSGTYNVAVSVADPNYVASGVPSTVTATSVVTPGTAVLKWTKPAAIVSTTPLGAAQLNATSTLPGRMVYTPAAGTFLKVGNNQALSVTFTPDDPNSPKVTATTTIDVLSGVSLVVRPQASPYFQSGVFAGYTLDMTITNNGTQTATSVSFRSAPLVTVVPYSATAPAAGFPQPVNIPAGGSAVVTFLLSPLGTEPVPGGIASVVWSGSYTGGTFSGSAKANLP